MKDLSGVARPLYTLLKKDVPFVWNKHANEAFEKLKVQIMTLPTLAFPNPRLPYDIHCDCSDTSMGACLVQEGRPVAYASKSLNSAQSNYNTTEKECKAVVWSLQYFHPYVYGANFTVYTDHAALKSILSKKMPRGRIARWIMAIQEYQPFVIAIRKGSLNADADALSRLDQNNQSLDVNTVSINQFKSLQKDDLSLHL